MKFLVVERGHAGLLDGSRMPEYVTAWFLDAAWLRNTEDRSQLVKAPEVPQRLELDGYIQEAATDLGVEFGALRRRVYAWADAQSGASSAYHSGLVALIRGDYMAAGARFEELASRSESRREAPHGDSGTLTPAESRLLAAFAYLESGAASRAITVLRGSEALQGPPRPSGCSPVELGEVLREFGVACTQAVDEALLEGKEAPFGFRDAIESLELARAILDEAEFPLAFARLSSDLASVLARSALDSGALLPGGGHEDARGQLRRAVTLAAYATSRFRREGNTRAWRVARCRYGDALVLLSQTLPPEEQAKTIRHVLDIYDGAMETVDREVAPVEWLLLAGRILYNHARLSDYVDLERRVEFLQEREELVEVYAEVLEAVDQRGETPRRK